MTATPIPRTLALTVYGDLSLSRDRRAAAGPDAGRHPGGAGGRAAPRSYDWLRRRLAAGAQAYVVFPLIDDSRHLDAGSIARLGGEVQGLLAGVRTAVLHGRTAAAERDAVMRAFAAGEIGALVATTVIEVGVDVPEATAMVIENAERFGLAQLHQLRGRVGRGGKRSVLRRRPRRPERAGRAPAGALCRHHRRLRARRRRSRAARPRRAARHPPDRAAGLPGRRPGA